MIEQSIFSRNWIITYATCTVALWLWMTSGSWPRPRNDLNELGISAVVVLFVFWCGSRLRQTRWATAIARRIRWPTSKEGPYRVIAVLHDGSHVIRGNGLTLREALALQDELATDESVFDFIREFDDGPPSS